MAKRITVYYMDQAKVDAGVIGKRLFFQDLGFTMEAGKQYAVSDEKVGNSEELSSALRMGWVRKKMISETPPKEAVVPPPLPVEEEPEPPPEEEPTPVEEGPVEEPPPEEEAAPEEEEGKQRTRESLGEIFDLAVSGKVINKTKKGNFTLLDKDGEGYLRFKDRDNAIDRFLEDESLIQHVESLLT